MAEKSFFLLIVWFWDTSVCLSMAVENEKSIHYPDIFCSYWSPTDSCTPLGSHTDIRISSPCKLRARQLDSDRALYLLVTIFLKKKVELYNAHILWSDITKCIFPRNLSHQQKQRQSGFQEIHCQRNDSATPATHNSTEMVL